MKLYNYTKDKEEVLRALGKQTKVITTNEFANKSKINRKRITDSFDYFIQNGLIHLGSSEKHGKQTWYYYKISKLGKGLLNSKTYSEELD